MAVEANSSSIAPSARIDLLRDVDVAYWCRLLDVDHAQLRRAVQQVGPRAESVVRYLQRKAPASAPEYDPPGG
ncbi:DUF3606 domain-containing protein [Methylibium sp.]|jgi:hypothetical protein|uniref:DUF3606 domain-containing protein n=1 Tax=Methylibium sp. TaxID=2067992 RepID=UPI003D116AD5